MNLTNGIVTGGSEASTHMHSNVLAYGKPPAQFKRDGGAGGVRPAMEDGAQAPSQYMMLISRVENMARRNSLDEQTLTQLRAYLTSRLGATSEAGRQVITNLNEFAALGVENIAVLPRVVAEAVREPSRAQQAFALLKQPTFSAYMRDDLRAQVYNPRGILQAS